jgi:molybdopterin converting factor small subunit
MLPAAAQALAGGVRELEVSAANFGQLVVELERRFPGLGRHVEREMALVVDGVIWQDAYDAPITGGVELVLIPKIKGG